MGSLMGMLFFPPFSYCLWSSRQEWWSGLPFPSPVDHVLSELFNFCMQVKNQKLEPHMEPQNGSKLGKEYVKAVYCHPAYLTYMQSTLCKMWAGWSSCWIPGRNISNLRYADDTTLMVESEEKLKSRLMRGKEEKAGLKLDFLKAKITNSGPMATVGETMETVTDYFSIFLGC